MTFPIFNLAAKTAKQHRAPGGHSWWIGALALICAMPSAADAQLFERATVIENARIITGWGNDIDKGSIVIKGGRIMELGPDVKAPMMSKKIDAAGKTITPGLIDVWSALTHLGASGQADPTARAASAVAEYAHQTITDALRNGVTTAYVGTRGGHGINGIGAIVKATAGEGGPRVRILDDDVALCIDLGSEQSAIKRLKTFKETRGAFKAAADYRQALEDYEEDLEEYLEKLEERRKEEEKNDKDGDGKDEEKDEGKEDKPDEPAPDEPAPDDEDKDEDKPQPDEPGRFSRSANAVLEQARGPRPGPPKNGKNGDQPGGNGEKDKKEDEDELKKPDKPRPDRKSDVILRAIDRDLPVRIEAHRSADILNAIALASEFKLDLIIEGATEAYLVAEEIAESKARVVLGAVTHTDVFNNDMMHRHSRRNAAALGAAQVKWSIGSGAASSRSARFVGMNARLAVAYGVTEHNWLELVTTQAARTLGLRGAGRIGRGMTADLVIWSAHPDDAAARVETVLLGGKIAYEADGETP